MKGSDIRKKFLGFFDGRDHTVVPSAPLVPIGDPTLLFTNAGMVPFKGVFTGSETRAYTRAASSQKCVRAGGKHNDLENVGQTARHLTFFEMLGNFSFGDYFKQEAIEYAWELLSKDFALPVDRLWASVFETDDEAYDLWKKLLPESRVVRLGEKDNFWAMGDTGPCGPCSEVHIDRGEAYAGEPHDCLGLECECDRYLELWNLVFMQYNRSPDGKMTPLPKPSIDTGAGLERLAMVMQDKASAYDCDIFAPILEKARGLGAGSGLASRVIADHARSAAFLIADGVFPDKTGREYVLRRIMRRAIRHGAMAGIDEPFFHLVCQEVIRTMKDAYPELGEKEKTINEVVRKEEERFRETLGRGLRLIEEWQAEGKKTIPGDMVFKLYDTFGFPTDLVEVIGREQGFAVDSAGFAKHMKRQQARSTFGGSGEKAPVQVSLDRDPASLHFVGYQRLEEESQIVFAAKTGDTYDLVVEATPFYAESGGQTADTGTITHDEFGLTVVDVRRSAAGFIAHRATLDQGRPPVAGDHVHLRVDSERRANIRRNHSGTHLLHYALRRVLGDHVMQKGSLVVDDRLRFDFSHFDPVEDSQLRAIEDIVNERVSDNAITEIVETTFGEAKKLGALAFFGEKYGDQVRVVRIGRDSLELCGGTHVGSAGDIGVLGISTERGIAQGVRRVEAITGSSLLTWAREQQTASSEREEDLLKQIKAREKEIKALRAKIASGGSRDLAAEAKDIKGIKLVAARIDEANPKALREAGDRVRDKLGSGVVVLCGVADGRVTVIAMVTPDLTKRVQAGKIVKELAQVLGGRGGGKPDMAQGGGGDPALIEKAIDLIPGLISA